MTKNKFIRLTPAFVVFFFLIFGISPHTITYADDETPTLSVDTGDNVNIGDDENVEVVGPGNDNLAVYASGGSTDAPSDDMGCPPWTKTGNVMYTWSIDGSDVSTSVDDGDTTTEPSMTVYLEGLLPPFQELKCKQILKCLFNIVLMAEIG